MRDGTGKIKNSFRLINNQGNVDFVLIVLVVILSVFGVVMVFSASYYDSINSFGTPYSYLWKQGLFAVTGLIIMLVVSHIDYHIYGHLAMPIAVVELVLLGLLLTPLGIEFNGATRWLGVGPITVMPGELAKPAIIIFTATYFTKDRERARKFTGLLPLAVFALVVCGLIVWQPNLSTAITVGVITVGIAFLAGMQWRYILLIAGGLAGGFAYLFFINDGYWHDRVMTFMDPFADALGSGFQVVQSLLALGTGGVTGLGLGKSVQKNLYLPEPQNDFILAIIGEELGFIGIAILMIVFVILVWRIFYIALNSKDQFGMLMAGGVAIMLGIQVVLNMAVVTSSMPPTGIALPFISYGGNALWIFMVLMGIVLNISRQSKGESEEE